MITLQIKRAYEPASVNDGTRFLVDRLWPRGIKKENLAIVAWIKEVAPSNELRKWFGHDPERWTEFRRRYRAELKANTTALQPLREAMKKGGVITLVYSAHDEEHNQAVVLREWLLAK